MTKTKAQQDAPYTMTFDELKEYLSDCKYEAIYNNKLVSFIDTDNKVGMFRRSDFVILYGDDNKPISVTERIYRRNYSILEWLRMLWQLRIKSKFLYQEYGFDILISIRGTFIDYSHTNRDKLEQVYDPTFNTHS